MLTSYSLATAAGKAVDLDTNKQIVWTKAGEGPPGSDIRFGNFGRVMANNPRSQELFRILEGSSTACQEAIAVDATGERDILAKELPKGSTLCIVTNLGRFAVLTVTKPATDTYIADGMEFKVDLYEDDS